MALGILPLFLVLLLAGSSASAPPSVADSVAKADLAMQSQPHYEGMVGLLASGEGVFWQGYARPLETDAAGAYLGQVDVQRGVVTQVATRPSRGAAISPDGKLLAYELGGTLILRGSDGAESMVVSGCVVGELAWHPGGDHLALTRCEGAEPERNVYVYQVSSGSLVQVTKDGASDRPAYGVSGEVLFYVGYGEGIPGLWTLDLSTGEREPLTNRNMVLEGRGGPPEGFVPVPARSPYFHTSQGLVYDALEALFVVSTNKGADRGRAQTIKGQSLLGVAGQVLVGSGPGLWRIWDAKEVSP